jgi:hypothetical protein
MFGFLKRKSPAPAKTSEAIAHQPPGEIFPWPQGTILTALDELVIALPMVIFGKDEQIGSVLLCSPNMQIHIPQEGDTFLIRLQPGMAVSLTKSCQARVVADDGKPRRLKISGPHVTNSA